MVRKIIYINEEKCSGCGICAEACHEGAIEIVNGKAKLIRDDYCDGFGDCLPGCPEGAITFEEREAADYDENAVKENMKRKTLNETAVLNNAKRHTELIQWPTQIKLMPVTAPYYDGAKLLIAADCTAFAYASMHEDFIKGHITINGCSKLDEVDYSKKLTQIIAGNNIKEVHVVRMEVPCCKGLENAAKKALQSSGKCIPWRVTVISVDGKLLINL